MGPKIWGGPIEWIALVPISERVLVFCQFWICLQCENPYNSGYVWVLDRHGAVKNRSEAVDMKGTVRTDAYYPVL